MGFTEILMIAFIILKLLNIINWNWFLVLLPEIIAIIIYAVYFILYVKLLLKTKKQQNKIYEKWRKNK